MPAEHQDKLLQGRKIPYYYLVCVTRTQSTSIQPGS